MICRLGQQIMPFCCIHAVVYKAIDWDLIKVIYSQNLLIGTVVLTAIYVITGIGGCILINHIKRRRIMKNRRKAIGGN